MGPNTMENGNSENIMAWEPSSGQTVAYTKVNGATVVKTEEASFLDAMEPSTRVNGSKENTTVAANSKHPMVKYSLELSKTESSSVETNKIT